MGTHKNGHVYLDIGRSFFNYVKHLLIIHTPQHLSTLLITTVVIIDNIPYYSVSYLHFWSHLESQLVSINYLGCSFNL